MYRQPSPSYGNTTLQPAKLISAAGKMADLTRTHDWSATPLGPIDRWSEELLCSVNLMLACRFPSVIFWGSQMIQFYNDAYLPLLAEKHPAALGQYAPDCWKEAWHIIGPQFEAVLARGETIYHENVLVPVTREGHLQDIYWTYSYSPIFYVSGGVAGILVVCHDVTGEVMAKREREAYIVARKHAEEELRRLFEERQQFFNLTEASQDFIGMCDLRGRPFYGNPAAYRLVGRENLQEFLNTDVRDFFFPEDRDFILNEFFPSILREGHGRVEIRFRHFHTQEGIWMDYQVYLLRDAAGEPFGFATISRNLTEQKRAATALLQTEKLAAVGRLAASIAHEINNPLESVTNLIYLARNGQDAAEIQVYLDTAERELRRVSVISNQTLRFYRQSTSPKPVTCEDLIESVLSIYQGRIVNSRIVVEKCKRASRPVLCFEGEIRQVLNNLVGNAIDAMPRAGGRLLLRSREATDWKTGQKGLVLTIADTGTGITPQAQKKMFEPFFTTKGASGTGLGLWVSQEIVARHGGALRVRTRQKPGASGTVFTLFLPFNAVIR